MVALTGAGISTAAGIPDFRGPHGLYVTRRYEPEKVFDIEWFFRAPLYFYEFSKDFITLTKDIAPTFTHRFLAALERRGDLAGIITQNIDGLHHGAGSRNVLELHGSYRSAVCSGCARRYQELSYDWWDSAMRNSQRTPVVLCDSCACVLKPEIVFFGEAVLAIDDARRLVEHCDLLIVLGSSLQVMPASLLPELTSMPTIVINKGDVNLLPAPYRYFAEDELDGYFGKVAACLGMEV